MTKFICGFCGIEFVFSDKVKDSRSHALQNALKHERECESNPLLIKVHELEEMLKLINVIQTDTLLGERVHELEKTLLNVKKECSRYIDTIKEPIRKVGFFAIERMITPLFDTQEKNDD